jgi:lipoate-protein ligase A
MRRAPTDPAPLSWRLLLDAPADAAANMAVDEILLEGYLADDSRETSPTLRLYGWRPGALSLGKGQAARGSHDASFLRREGLGLVRRPTGGQAVLHEGERTYCVAGRLDRAPFDRGVLATYEAISGALRLGLERLGVSTTLSPQRSPARASGPVCFNVAASHELLNEGRKLIGSAQLRRGRAFLQHGSIPYLADAARLGAAIGVPADGERFTGLDAALGRRPSDDEVDAALVAGFEQTFGVALMRDERTPDENARVEKLRCWKYLSASWTLNGKLDASDATR